MTGMMSHLLDTILPGDIGLGLPPGSHVDMARYVSEQGIEDRVRAFLAMLDDTARDMDGADFAGLAPDRRLACVERAKRKDFRLANAVIVHCLKAYYTDPEVLRRLSAGAVPPFPDGNVLDDDDWSILEPVFERGPIFRPITP